MIFHRWRDKGKEADGAPPPPYQAEWVEARVCSTGVDHELNAHDRFSVQQSQPEAIESETQAPRPPLKQRPKSVARKSTLRRRPTTRARPRLPLPRDDGTPSRPHAAVYQEEDDLQGGCDDDAKDQVCIGFDLVRTVVSLIITDGLDW